MMAGLSYWVADCGCLAFAFLAVGAPVPWQGLLLAYCAAQLAVNLPITPGGLGVVEGSLTVALVAFGGGRAPVVAAVLLYRLDQLLVAAPGWRRLLCSAGPQSAAAKSGVTKPGRYQQRDPPFADDPRQSATFVTKNSDQGSRAVREGRSATP